MNVNETEDERLLLLIERFYLNDLTSEELRQLELALDGNRKLRDRFRAAAVIDAGLRFRTSEEVAEKPLVQASVSRQGWFRWAMIGLAATFLIGLLSLRSFIGSSNHVSPQVASSGPTTDEPEVSPIAVDSLRPDGSIAEFVIRNELVLKGPVTADGSLSPGDYEVTKGEGTLRLNNGVELTLQSPAKFRLVDKQRIEWTLGRARAYVPPEGHGFRVITPQGEIEDLGTEFGFLVAEDQTSEVHVFAGEVRLLNDGQPPQQYQEDTAVKLVSGERRVLDATAAASFVTRGQIGFKRWLATSRALRNDPSAILYYDFSPDPSDPERLMDQSANSLIDGQIAGGIVVSGRWPQKSALLFDDRGDRIELSIPGQYDFITLLAWIQVTRFDLPMQTLFNTVDYDPGEHHLNLLRDGVMRVGIREGYTSNASKRPLLTGRWTQLAVVITPDTARYYVDGESVLTVVREDKLPIVFGDCSIGAFGKTKVSKSGVKTVGFHRELRGRIDEFAIFSRAFTSDEISRLFEAGNNSGW
ncbi:MAG: LamG-like jellyroll fold domain-containing protein [Planctomycetota bacterium]